MANENDVNPNQSDAGYIKEIGNILETVRKPFLVLEKNGVVIFANQRFYDAYKITPDQVLGHPLSSIADKEWDIPALRHLLEVVLAEKDSAGDDYEIEYTFPRFGYKILRINGQSIFLSGIGRQVLLLSLEDYTKRKLQEKQLFESEERFRRLFETSHDGLLLVNKETGVIIEVNAAFTELLGITREEAVGKQIQEAGVVGKETDLQSMLERLVDKGFYAFDNVLINLKSSLPFPAQITITDRSTVIQCNIRDISERILENELLQKTANEWQATFNAVPDLITVVDRDMRILRTNDAFNQFFCGNKG